VNLAMLIDPLRESVDQRPIGGDEKAALAP
jgi:hypothetical protein